MIVFLEYVESLGKHLYDQIGKYKVYEINGEKIRKIKANHEFSDSATHLDFPKLIPENEIWIDNAVKPDERFFLIYFHIEHLKTNNYDKALMQERKLREITDKLKFNPDRINNKANAKVYNKKYGVADGVTIWLVNGRIVRDLHKTDFTEGGHGYVYSWIPNDEIWIEKDLSPTEIPLVILHEFVERSFMKNKKMKYNKAHALASKLEFAKEDKFDKSNALALTEKSALAMIKKT